MRPILILLLFLPALALAQTAPPPFEAQPPEQSDNDPFDPDRELPRIIEVQTEWIELPQEQLTKLIFQRAATSSDATALRKDLQTLADAGTAKILEIQMITTRSGEKSTVESFFELIYPSEWDSWSIPESVTVPDKPGGMSPENLKALAALVAPAAPTSFETRNVGGTLEVEATSGETNKYIDLRFNPELIWHTGNTVWQERKDVLGNVIKIEEPEFYVMRAPTALTLANNTYTLAAILTPKNQQGRLDFDRKVLLFVKAAILTVK
jgi:hypothetical protein